MLFTGTDTFGPGYIDRTVEGTGGRSTFDPKEIDASVGGAAESVQSWCTEEWQTGGHV
jgi:hypothetical protein